MFAIYDTQGRRFRDSLEQLNKVKAIHASEKIPFQLRGGEQAAQNQATSSLSASVKAKQAYRDMLKSPKQEAILHAYQLMSQPVVTVQSSLDIVSAWQRLHKLHYQQLPVLDRAHRIVGMVSDRDLLQFLLCIDQKLSYVPDKTVADAMSENVITSDPVTDVRRIAKAMIDYHLSAIPIVDENDSLIGLVSRSDIVQAVTTDPPLSLWT